MAADEFAVCGRQDHTELIERHLLIPKNHLRPGDRARAQPGTFGIQDVVRGVEDRSASLPASRSLHQLIRDLAEDAQPRVVVHAPVATAPNDDGTRVGSHVDVLPEVPQGVEASGRSVSIHQKYW